MALFNSKQMAGGIVAGIAAGISLFSLARKFSAPLPLLESVYTAGQKQHSIDLKNNDWDQQYQHMVNLYPVLINDFITFIQAEHALPAHAVARLRRLCDYTIIGGKYNRALLVTNTVKILCEQSGADSRVYGERAVVLGWCIEILQALFLVADDIMDSSVTRRGKPCWYKLADVKLDAVNDTLILEALMYYLLNRYFIDNKHQYVALTQLFQQVTLNTEMGQMLDLLSQPQGQKSVDILHSFNMDVYNKIVKYKTCLYSFYLPIASALILFNNTAATLPAALAVAHTLSVELGTKFQIQDDYLDAYQDAELLGKIGTDIRDHKCSWLVVQALQRCNKQQLATLEQHYGHESGEPAVKQLYRDLDLQGVYDEQEQSSYERIERIIVDNDALLPAEVARSILKKIHKREK